MLIRVHLVGWALLERRVVTWAIVLLLIGLTVITLAEQAGLVTYAPLRHGV